MQRARGNPNMSYIGYGCLLFTLLVILGLSIAITVGVFNGTSSSSSSGSNGSNCLAQMAQPIMCSGTTVICPSPLKCCNGICRDPNSFGGPCTSGAPASCSGTTTPCDPQEFCCTSGTGSGGLCRPFDWPAKCGTFDPVPIGRCDPIQGAACPTGYSCCKNVCRATGHPAC